jgi:hypothetical protein
MTLWRSLGVEAFNRRLQFRHANCHSLVTQLLLVEDHNNDLWC